ncbi:MAG: DNA internalization-related competence protein ComEC/Rec2 [Colwellia sp.]
MDWWLLTFFIGAVLSLFSPVVPEFVPLFITLLVCLGLCHYRLFRLNSGVVFGCLWMFLYANHANPPWIIDNKLKIEAFASVGIVEGRVISLQTSLINEEPGKVSVEKQTKQRKQREKVKFVLEVRRFNGKRVNKPYLLKLSWNNPSFNLLQGQVVNLKVAMKPAHGLANIGGFSYQTWLKSKHIWATGYVVKSSLNKIVLNQLTYRQQLYLTIKGSLPKHELSPLILALTFGDRSQFSPELWQILQATGTGHLIAISGLHIGLVASAVFLFMTLLFRYFPSNLIRKFMLLAHDISVRKLSLFAPRLVLSKYINSNKYNAKISTSKFSVSKKSIVQCSIIKVISQKISFQRINIKFIIVIVSLAVAFFYGYLAGYSLPTIRALVMISLYWLSRFIGIKTSLIRWLLLTLFIITMTSPFSLFTASFWLSFYAVFMIFISLWRFKFALSSGGTFYRFVKGLLIIQLTLTFMLLPITGLFFGQFSGVSLLANIVAVPWMSFVTIPLSLISIFASFFSSSVTEFSLQITLKSITFIWQWLSYLSGNSFANVFLSQDQRVLLIAVGCIGFILMLAGFNKSTWQQLLRKQRFVFVVITVVMVTIITLITFSMFQRKIVNDIPSGHNHFMSNDYIIDLTKGDVDLSWQLYVLDVGQGLSILIVKDNRAILYDTGGAYSSGFNMVDAVILPFLKHQNIVKLDKVIISHSDNDHAGGLAVLLNNIEVGQVIMNDIKNYQQQVMSIKQSHKPLFKLAEMPSFCEQGKQFSWQGLSFNMLWPDKLKGRRNDDSCVVLISDNAHSVLLTGDISKSVEKKLITQYPNLRSDVLITPHHGSKTSSSIEFIKQINPGLAIMSTGFYNRWKLPAGEVVKRYKKMDIDILNTAETGQIMLTMPNHAGKNEERNPQNPKKIEVRTYREELWPFWFAK